MTQYISPLVDVNEIDLSTTIPAVATAIGVIILRNTWKGDELKVKMVNSIDELIEAFGRPEEASTISPVHGQSYEDLLAGTGFLQFAQNLYCTRVLPPSATFAGVYGIIDELVPASSSSSSTSSSSTSISISNSSSSSSCVEGYIDTTNNTDWEVDTYGSWNGIESRFESVGGDPDHILVIDPGLGGIVVTKNPPTIRIEVEIPSGWTDFNFDDVIIRDTQNDIIYQHGPFSVLGFDTPLSVILTPISYDSNCNNIGSIEITSQNNDFYLNSIEIYEDCVGCLPS